MKSRNRKHNYTELYVYALDVCVSGKICLDESNIRLNAATLPKLRIDGEKY